MKKSIILSTALSLGLFSGCGGNTTDTSKYATLSSNFSKSLSTLSVKQSTNEARYDGELSHGCDTSNYIVIDKPTNGTVTLHENGYYTYIPTSGYKGSDSFSYKKDATSTCSAEVVTIDVNTNNQSFATAPSELTVTLSCPTKLNFNWKDNSDNEEEFVIYQDGKPIQITEFDKTEVSINFEPKDGAVYNFEVRAKNSAGVSVGESLNFKIVDSKIVPIKTTPIQQEVVNPVDIKTLSDFGNILAITPLENSDDVLVESYTTVDGKRVTSYNLVSFSNSGEVKVKKQDSNGNLLTKILKVLEDKYGGTYNKYSVDILLSKDKKKAFISHSRTLKTLDISNLSDIKELSSTTLKYSVSNMLVSDDSKTLFVITDYDVKILDTSNPSEIKELSSITLKNEIVKMSRSNDSKTLFLITEEDGYSEKYLEVLDISSYTEPRLTGVKFFATSINLSEDGSKAYTYDYLDRKFDIYDISDKENFKLLKTYKNRLFLGMSPDKSKAFIQKNIYRPETVHSFEIIDLENDYSVLGSLENIRTDRRVIPFIDNTKVIVTDFYDYKKLIFVDIQDSTIIKELVYDNNLYHKVLSANGKKLFFTMKNKETSKVELHIIDLYHP